MIFLSLMVQIYIDICYGAPVIQCGNINFVILGYDNDLFNTVYYLITCEKETFM